MSITPENAPLRPAYVRDTAGLYYKVSRTAPEVYAQAVDPGASSGATAVLWVDTDDISVGAAPGGITQADADIRYASKQYVDQTVTVSTSEPSGVPARDGLLWVVIP